MPVKHSPGCGCCAVDTTGCCLTTDLKDLPVVSYNPSTTNYSFTETQWYYTDSNGDRQSYFTGDVPADGSLTPNVLPAGSTVTAEFNICCLDFIFDVEIITWDQNDKNSYVKCGATQWRSFEWDSSTQQRCFIQSRTAYEVGTSSNLFAIQGYKAGYVNVEMGSFLGNGSTGERVVAFNYHPRRGSPGYQATEITVDSDGMSQESWTTNLSRPIKLVIHAGDSDLEIGAIRLRQGSNTTANSNFPQFSCINYNGTTNRRVPGATGYTKYTWPKVVKGASVYKSGYGTTTISSDCVGRTSCNIFLPPALYNARTQPKHTYTNTFDFSGRNGNWSYSLKRLNNDINSFTGVVDASLADETSITDLASACRTDDWESISLIPDWWRLWWVEPTACPAAVTDWSNCNGNPVNSVDSSCTSPTTSPSFSSSNNWPWYFLSGVNNANPCPYYDLLDFSDITQGGFYRYAQTTPLYQWQDPAVPATTWGGYGDPNWAGATLQTTINTWLSTNDPVAASGCDVDGFSSSKYWSTSWLQFVVANFFITASGVDRFDSPNAPSPRLLAPEAIPTVSHSSTAFSGGVYANSQGNVVVSGYTERQLGFSVYKTWVENVQGTNETLVVDGEVQGGWTGETLHYEDYEKASIPDTKHGRTTNYKVHENCIHNFEVTETVYSGSPPVAGTPVTTLQDSPSTIPSLVYQGGSSVRPTGVYDDGKIYEYSDDTFYLEAYTWTTQGYLLHQVTTDDNETWHILFGHSGDIAEIRRLSDNTKFSNFYSTASTTGCSGQDFTKTFGSSSVAGTVTEFSFTVKGTR
jgi:hypothetical protein